MRPSTKIALATFLLHAIVIVTLVAIAFRSNSGLETWYASMLIAFVDIPLIPCIGWIGNNPIFGRAQFLLTLITSLLVGGGFYGGFAWLIGHLLFDKKKHDVRNE